jgi:hypothetical protein
VCVVSLKDCPSLLLYVNICDCKQKAQLHMAAVILFLILIGITIGTVAALGHKFYNLEKAIKPKYNFPFSLPILPTS